MTISLTFDTDVYTWLGIKNAATELSIACHTSGRTAKTGGETITGMRDRIKIELTYTKVEGLVDETNSTVTEA